MLGMIGLSLDASRHAVLHYAVHMAAREAASSSDPVSRATWTIRKVAGLAWDTFYFAPNPQLPIKVDIRDGISRVDAKLLNDGEPFLSTSVNWRLPRERESNE